MFCKKCGANLPDGSKFCPSCGATQEEETHRSWLPIWKLASGIISIVAGGILMLPSCAVSCTASLAENDAGFDLGASLLWTSGLILAGGIVSIASRKSNGNRGNIAMLVLYALAAILCGINQPVYTVWSTACAIVAVVGIVRCKKL